MLVKINIDNDTFSRIKELISKGKYSDLYQFIGIAVSNQIQEEFAEKMESRTPEIANEISIVEGISEFEHRVKTDAWQQKLQEIHLESSKVESKKKILVWSFYNRFLPVKLVVHELAVLIVTQNTAWIELDKLKDYAYAYALSISKKLKEYEDKIDAPRNQKLSTGLPTPMSELDGLRGAQRRKKELKLLSSKSRFMAQFVGRKTSGDTPEFHGACFSMGLMAVKFEGNVCFVSLTENGRKFALLNNPIIDGNQTNIAFFNDEVIFIMENIIPRYPLEKIIVDRILDELKKHPLTSNDINDIFSIEKTKYLRENPISSKNIAEDLDKDTIIAERVSTMGRLSEMGLVNWTIDSRGISTYTIKGKQS